MRFTVLGASGFIGSHLAAYLRRAGHECMTPERGDPSIFADDLGHVIYCIGLTADFRQRPYDTVEAHVCHLSGILRRARFDSLLYLSSTRVYMHAVAASEDADLVVNSANPSDLYNLSKLMGESLCLATAGRNVRIARLSNVYGRGADAQNFLSAVLREALEGGRVLLETGLDSGKDYVSISDVVALLPRISLGGRHRVYNVASGYNLRNGELMEKIRELTGCWVEVKDGAATISFPVIDIRRIRDEFGFSPSMLKDDLGALMQQSQTMR
ncbi:MAG TPA: NAD(P)-dependent oxidoreductase [Gallionella sp.]|nr:NAD(P)-dependent oxidoreductase [Gallionella sp.]